MNLKDPDALSIYHKVKDRDIEGSSIGTRVTYANSVLKNVDQDDEYRLFNKAQLRETSIVTRPAMAGSDAIAASEDEKVTGARIETITYDENNQVVSHNIQKYDATDFNSMLENIYEDALKADDLSAKIEDVDETAPVESSDNGEGESRSSLHGTDRYRAYLGSYSSDSSRGKGTSPRESESG